MVCPVVSLVGVMDPEVVSEDGRAGDMSEGDLRFLCMCRWLEGTCGKLGVLRLCAAGRDQDCDRDVTHAMRFFCGGGFYWSVKCEPRIVMQRAKHIYM